MSVQRNFRRKYGIVEGCFEIRLDIDLTLYNRIDIDLILYNQIDNDLTLKIDL